MVHCSLVGSFHHRQFYAVADPVFPTGGVLQLPRGFDIPGANLGSAAAMTLWQRLNPPLMGHFLDQAIYSFLFQLMFILKFMWIHSWVQETPGRDVSPLNCCICIQFSAKKIQNNRLAHRPRKLASLLGNPGSATGIYV